MGYGCNVENEVHFLSSSGFDRADSVHRPVLDVHVKDVLTNEGVAEPRLCADVILFLASDLSRGVNGAIIPVDQGWSVI